MNRTANYDLCQWEKNDQILMEDFNADNAKIEAALADLESRKCNQSTLMAVANVVGIVNRDLDDLKKRVTALENK